MQTRPFANTGRSVGEIGFGAWAIGASWGHVADEDAIAALHAALDSGTTFLDTADVYGDGRSERLIAQVLRDRPGERPYVATKAGRRLPAQTVEGYSKENLTSWIDRSRENLETDTLDLVQLHCPPTALYESNAVFDILDELKQQRKILDYGVSVEKIAEAERALDHPGIVSIQIIYNIFRQRPAVELFSRAKQRNVAIIARVPLSSGLLTGKFSTQSAFAADDHRQFNRNGEAFDVGETFSGVPYEAGLAAVERIRPLIGGDASFAQFAVRWILMSDAVTVVIPGARNEAQARSNAEAALLPPLAQETMAQLVRIYDEDVRPHVHHRW